ncbi:hypothetical protein B0T17DRAFT_88996 [Bombardia bombarda]|uniref:Secreted protein n=1 Tax=Bombardia bombarda TaxID=252184 RepID=A0AA39XMF7_9PEZI|nr:hypothetical protein B0T17DRAFT_88996 [Bombardia bombarda]
MMRRAAQPNDSILPLIWCMCSILAVGKIALDSATSNQKFECYEYVRVRLSTRPRYPHADAHISAPSWRGRYLILLSWLDRAPPLI